jgi:hypothetical protein
MRVGELAVGLLRSWNSAVAALLDRPIAAAFSSWRNPWDPVRIAALNVRDGIPLGVRTSRVWTSSFESDSIVPSERSVGSVTTLWCA